MTRATVDRRGQLEASAPASFVPRLLADRLVRAPLEAPERLPLDGAFLLSDIVAFTTHLEKCSHAGRLNDVITTFDAYFAALTTAVLAYGGDVLTTAGDAFLTYWPAGQAGAGEAVEAACRAASAALLATTGELQSRVGIAAGTGYVDLIGGVCGRWEVVPGGPAVSEVMGCEAAATPGVPCLTAVASALLGERAQGRARPDGRWDLQLIDGHLAPEERDGPDVANLPDVPPERLAPFVPAPVVRWGAAAAEWMAEFRPVTTVVASLRALPDGAAETFDRRNRLVLAFQEIAHRYEAASKVQFDGKGPAASLVFGLPPRAHADDVDRALQAGCELSAALVAHGLPAGVGISHGPVCCGVFGSAGRHEYTLFGDAVNVASRLAALAGDEILVDRGTTSATTLALELERRPTAAVKNRRFPLRVHRLVSLRRAPRRAAAMIGRDEELARLQAAIDALARGQSPSPVLIRGHPGIGKSTLVEAVVRAARAHGLEVVTIVGEPLERGTSYHALRPLVSPLLGDADREEMADRAGLSASARELLPLLNPFLDRPLPDTPTTAALSGDARRDRLHELLVGVLRHATASRPKVLVVEDLQWLDSLSRNLLDRLVAEVPGLFALFTAWSGEAEPGAGVHCDVMELGPLDAAQVTELVLDRLRVGEVAPSILTLVLERAGGHPFFTEALLESMIQGGAIQITDEGARLLDSVSLAVPATINAAVLSRLDALEASEQLTLKAAAIVGRTFTVEEVAAAHPLAELDAVAGELHALAERDLVAAEPTGAYAFRHQIIQEVARGLLPEARVRQMHRTLATYYESRRAAPPPPEHLAHHWLQAGAPEPAARYLEVAGREALHHGAFADAVTLLVRAMRASPDADERRRALQELALADAHYFLGDLPHSRALLEQALERLGYGSMGTAAATLREVGRSLAFRLAPAPLRRSATDTESAELLRTASNAMRRLVQIGYLHGSSPLETARLAVRSLELAERAGPSPELARAMVNAGVLASLCGLRGLAGRYARRAIHLAEDAEHAPAAAYVWNVVAILRVGEGRWAEAVEASDRALDRFSAVGDYTLEAELWQTRSAIELNRGALDRAEIAWRRTRALAEQTGSAMNRCLSLLDEAQTELARGQAAAGRTALDAALGVVLVEADAGTLMERRATTAIMRLEEGRHAEAAREADAVLAVLARRPPLEWVWVEFGIVALEVLLDLRTLPRADIPLAGLDRRIHRGLRAVARGSLSFPAWRTRLEILRGHTALTDGDRAAAARHLQRAQRQIDRPDQVLDGARADVLAARLATDPRRRAELLARADAVFAGLGQTRERRRAEVLVAAR